MNLIELFDEIIDLEVSDYETTQELSNLIKIFKRKLLTLKRYINELTVKKEMVEKDLEVITDPNHYAENEIIAEILSLLIKDLKDILVIQ